MSLQFESGDRVRFADNSTGRILNVINLSDETTKAADDAEDTRIARVRVTQYDQPINEVRVVPLNQLARLDQEAEATTPETVTKAAAVAEATEAQLDELLSKLSETERSALAVALFSDTGPRLPTLIIGEEGPRGLVPGVDQAGNAMPDPAAAE